MEQGCAAAPSRHPFGRRDTPTRTGRRAGRRRRAYGSLLTCDRGQETCGGGPAIEAPDPAALARFYSELLGWPIEHEEPGTTVLATPQGATFVVFQQASGYRSPVWPPVEGEQRPMMHLDFQVADLDSAVAEAVALGATVAAAQPQERVRVLFDPAGHPFCLCLDQD